MAPGLPALVRRVALGTQELPAAIRQVEDAERPGLRVILGLVPADVALDHRVRDPVVGIEELTGSPACVRHQEEGHTDAV